MPVRKFRKPHLGTLGGYRNHPRYRGVVGHWMMAEGSGGTVRDISGKGNHGTLTNMNPPTDWVPGQFGKVLDFDADNDEVNLGQDIFSGNIGTIIAWIKFNDLAQIQTFFSTSDTSVTDKYWKLEITIGGQLQSDHRTTGSQDRMTGTVVLSSGTWYQVVFSSDGSSYTFYVDAVEDAVQVGQGSDNGNWYDDLSAGTYDNWIGRWTRSTSNRTFDGLIDEVRVYNRFLNPAEIWSLYQEPFLEFNFLNVFGTRNLEIDVVEEPVIPPPPVDDFVVVCKYQLGA